MRCAAVLAATCLQSGCNVVGICCHPRLRCKACVCVGSAGARREGEFHSFNFTSRHPFVAGGDAELGGSHCRLRRVAAEVVFEYHHRSDVGRSRAARDGTMRRAATDRRRTLLMTASAVKSTTLKRWTGKTRNEDTIDGKKKHRRLQPTPDSRRRLKKKRPSPAFVFNYITMLGHALAARPLPLLRLARSSSVGAARVSGSARAFRVPFVAGRALVARASAAGGADGTVSAEEAQKDAALGYKKRAEESAAAGELKKHAFFREYYSWNYNCF